VPAAEAQRLRSIKAASGWDQRRFAHDPLLAAMAPERVRLLVSRHVADNDAADDGADDKPDNGARHSGH
jgi:hypothetical protein